MSSMKLPTDWARLLTLRRPKIAFRNRGYLTRAERWYYGSGPVSVASSCKYLGLKFATKVCLNCIPEDSILRAKQGTIEIFKVLWNVGCFDANVFFSNCSMHRLYLSYSMDLNCGVVLIVLMLRKCTCAPVKGY